MLLILGKVAGENNRIFVLKQRKIIFQRTLARPEYARVPVYFTDYPEIYGDIRILRQLAPGVDVLSARGLDIFQCRVTVRQSALRLCPLPYKSAQVPSPTFCAARILSLKLSSHVSPFLKSGAVPIYFVPVGRVTVTLPLAAKFRRIQHSKLPVGYVSVKVVTSVRRYSVLSARAIFEPVETFVETACGV